MKRKLTLLYCLLVATTPLFSRRVTNAEAQLIAAQFLAGGTAGARSTEAQPQPTLATAAAGGAYYVFNAGGGQGFVIVGGDDRLPAVWGYADHGDYDPLQSPPALTAILSGYADELHALATDEETATAEAYATARARRAAMTTISPMLTTHWDQGSPYNGQCPLVSGVRTEVGCVGTAMAQLVNYHRWPQSATTYIPAYGRASAAPSTTFNWASMTQTETAKLMLYCATAIKTDFGTRAAGGSGATLSTVVTALKTYFGYDGGAVFVSRSDYDYDQWTNLIYTELSCRRPVLLGGNSPSMGHAFVADGYQGGYFHINWGWSGSYDGYFLLSLLDHTKPKATSTTVGNGFNLAAHACVGIQPPGFSVVAPAVVAKPSGAASLAVTSLTYSGTLGREQAKSVSLTVRNSGSGDFHGDLTIGFVWSGYIARRGGTCVDIKAGETRTVTISAAPPVEGTLSMNVYQGYFELGTRLYQKTVTVGATGSDTGGSQEQTETARLTVYDAKGNTSQVAVAAMVTTPATAACVDLRGQQTVTSVVPNSNPNTVYLFDSGASIPSGLSGRNVVQGTQAARLSLTDGYDFMTPISFTALTATYTRTMTQGTDGHGGWTTLIVPFDVDRVMVGTTQKYWFQSATDTGKHFWLKCFSSDAAGTLAFAYADKLQANTPYIMAVPGDAWGTEWSLVGKTMTFTGYNKKVASSRSVTQGSNYRFVGTTVSRQLTSAYALNATGEGFVRQQTVDSSPFRAYFFPTTTTDGVLYLNITTDGHEPTAVSTPTATDIPAPPCYYHLDGRRVAESQSLPRGIYIDRLTGRKVVVR